MLTRREFRLNNIPNTPTRLLSQGRTDEVSVIYLCLDQHIHETDDRALSRLIYRIIVSLNTA